MNLLKKLFMKIPHPCLVDPFCRLITCTAFTRCEAPPLAKSYSRRGCYTKLAVLTNPDPDVLLPTEFLQVRILLAPSSSSTPDMPPLM